MPFDRLELGLDPIAARRLRARAAAQATALEDVARHELAAWLGDWGSRYVAHAVQPGETLTGLARRYYHDVAWAPVIAAYNGLDGGRADRIAVGQVLLLPELGEPPELPPGGSPYIYGLHDRGGEHYMGWAGRKGWVVISERLGARPDDWTSASYADLADDGYGVIVRLNHGHGHEGTLPVSGAYKAFASRCGNFCERSSGCHIWIIGNEVNMAWERPGGPEHGEVITPRLYAEAFRRCRDEIRRRPGHADDQIVIGAVAPWNVQTVYPDNPSGDWIIYFQQVLDLLADECAGIALHTYARDADPASITSEARMGAPFEHRRSMFRTYIDYMEAIPSHLRHLPVYITETDQNQPWRDDTIGWVQAAYAEIDRWNSDPSHQKVRCLALYRWERHDQWHIQGKPSVIDDFRQALRHEYRWHP